MIIEGYELKDEHPLHYDPTPKLMLLNVGRFDDWTLIQLWKPREANILEPVWVPVRKVTML